MIDEDKIPDLLKLAKIKINISVGILVFICLLILQHYVFPDIFKEKVDVQEVVLTEDEYVPMFEVDSAEIENGIHIPSGLIVDDGFEVVMGTCGACHSLSLVTQNRADRAGWKDIIVWMQETQKLWDLGDQEDIILDYLAKNYAPENSGRRKNLENIEWYNL